MKGEPSAATFGDSSGGDATCPAGVTACAATVEETLPTAIRAVTRFRRTMVHSLRRTRDAASRPLAPYFRAARYSLRHPHVNRPQRQHIFLARPPEIELE